jgi:hypothetical protein
MNLMMRTPLYVMLVWLTSWTSNLALAQETRSSSLASRFFLRGLQDTSDSSTGASGTTDGYAYVASNNGFGIAQFGGNPQSFGSSNGVVGGPRPASFNTVSQGASPNAGQAVVEGPGVALSESLVSLERDLLRNFFFTH